LRNSGGLGDINHLTHEDDGLPFGLEISGPRWSDGTLLGFAYAYEQATHNRRLPKLKQ
jgi:Asp-tRNA(Asn)/Glu-tRNA(Gln) amidotransferase A subunit family amidase